MLNNKHFAYIEKVRTTYHDYLFTTPRYERFMDGESLGEWVTMLGPDVRLLTHADETATIAERFITYNENQGLKLLSEEKSKLLLAAWIHDWGEIIIDGEGVGDVTFELKTDADQAIETIIVNKVLQLIDDETVRESFHIAYQEIVLKKDPRMGEMFNAVERLGYMETAIAAYKGKNKKRIENWQGLCGNVLSNQIEKLFVYSNKYPYVKYYLEKETDIIDQIFAEVKKEIPDDNTNQLSYNMNKFSNAYLVWNNSAK